VPILPPVQMDFTKLRRVVLSYLNSQGVSQYNMSIRWCVDIIMLYSQSIEIVGPMDLTKRTAMCCHLSGQPFNKHIGGM